ncbi:MAG: ABC transporter substrate-binding protein [Collinsella sp.]
MFNVAKEPWNNVKVRQAVMYALDTEKMITNTFAGLATAASCYLPKSFTNYHEASTVYKTDAKKAKKLIEESGITRAPSPCAPPTTSRSRAWPLRSRTTSTPSALM